MKNNAIFNEHQYSFRSDASTKNASHILLSEILAAMKSKHMVGGIFYDLHEAFDCVNYVVLLEKLKFYGVSKKFYNFYEIVL